MTSNELRQLIDGLAGLPYGGEPVDQRQHALQAAAQAQAEGADGDLVLAALLHDIGRAEAVAQLYPGEGHDAAGEKFLRDVLGERIAWLVGSHAEAKRYLVTTQQTYAAMLTPASVRSLEVQGGRMTPDEVSRFEAHPWSRDAVRLRRWDEGAKDPGAPGADLGRAHRDLREVPLDGVSGTFDQAGHLRLRRNGPTQPIANFDQVAKRAQ